MTSHSVAARRRRTASILLGALAGLAALFGAASPARAVTVERVVAVIGDEAILLTDLRNRARPFLVQVYQKAPQGPQRDAAQSKILQDLLEKMVEEELIGQASEKANIHVTPDEIDNAFRNIGAAQGMTVAQLFEEARTKSGLSEQDYRDEIRRQLLEGKMLQLRLKGRLRVTDDDIKGMFERTVREEKKRREYHPAWLVLRVLPGSSPAAVAERMKLAEAIYQRALAGEDFAALVSQYSDDTATRPTGGDLGIRAPVDSQAAQTGRRKTLSPDLEAAVMGLEVGEVTKPLTAGPDFVIIKLLSRQPSRYTTLEKARPEMLQRLQNEMFQKAKKKWVEELKRKTYIDVSL